MVHPLDVAKVSKIHVQFFSSKWRAILTGIESSTPSCIIPGKYFLLYYAKNKTKLFKTIKFMNEIEGDSKNLRLA